MNLKLHHHMWCARYTTWDLAIVMRVCLSTEETIRTHTKISATVSNSLCTNSSIFNRTLVLFHTFCIAKWVIYFIFHLCYHMSDKYAVAFIFAIFRVGFCNIPKPYAYYISNTILYVCTKFLFIWYAWFEIIILTVVE